MSTDARALSFPDLVYNMMDNAEFCTIEQEKLHRLQNSALRDKRKLVYVYDTTIIKGYCAPWNAGPLGEGKGGIGQIMPLQFVSDKDTDQINKTLSREKHQAEIVARLLCDHVIKANASRGFPAYQLPAQFDETDRVYEAVRRDAKAATNSIGFEVLQKHDRSQLSRWTVLLRQRMSKQIKSDPVLERMALTLADDLAKRSLSVSEPMREWSNFCRLNQNIAGIYSLKEFRYADDGKRKGDPQSDVILQKILLELSEPKGGHDKFIEKRFYAILNNISSSKPSTNVQVDSEALSQLFNLSQNEDIARYYKFVLVTADRALVEAMNNSKEEIGFSRQYQTFREFSNEHIIHLWGFVDRVVKEKNIGLIGSAEISHAPVGGNAQQNSEEDQQLPFVGFFSGLLAQRYSIEQDQSKTNDRIWFNKLDRNEIDIAYRKWEEFCTQTGTGNLYLGEMGIDDATHKDLQNKILNVFKASFAGANVDWNKLQNRVLEYLLRARDRSNVSFSDIGADTLVLKKYSGVRNSPDLLFDGLTATSNILDKMASANNKYDNVSIFNSDFDRVSDDCGTAMKIYDAEGYLKDNDDRQEIYLKYLILGTLFASANRWSLALEQAKNALSILSRAEKLREPIVPNMQKPEQILSGREAHYLRAICLRTLSKRASHLNSALTDLLIAEQLLRDEKRKNPLLRISCIRFRNERLAIALSRYYLLRKEYRDVKFEGEANEIYELYLNLKNDYFSDDEVRLLKPGTSASIATNIIQVGVVSRYREYLGIGSENDNSVSDEDLEKALGELYKNSNFAETLAARLGVDKLDEVHTVPHESTVDRCICSDLMLRYGITCALLLPADHRFWRPKSPHELEKIFAIRASITAYDEWRFNILKQYTEALLSV